MRMLWLGVQAFLTNMQSCARAVQVAEAHYDLDNALFEVMLDPRMAYSLLREVRVPNVA